MARVKWYFHDAASGNSGTLPAAGTSVSQAVPTIIMAGGDTNRAMTSTIGVAQTSRALTTQANTNPQSTLMARWLSPPLTSSDVLVFREPDTTFVWKCSLAYSQSNTNSNFTPITSIVIWRPSTGAIVGRRLMDTPQTGGATWFNCRFLDSWENPTTSQVCNTSICDFPDGSLQSDFIVGGAAQESETASVNDIIVFELWRNSAAQAMGTAYTNTIYYDGTVEESNSDTAAYLEAYNDRMPRRVQQQTTAH